MSGRGRNYTVFSFFCRHVERRRGFSISFRPFTLYWFERKTSRIIRLAHSVEYYVLLGEKSRVTLDSTQRERRRALSSVFEANRYPGVKKFLTLSAEPSHTRIFGNTTTEPVFRVNSSRFRITFSDDCSSTYTPDVCLAKRLLPGDDGMPFAWDVRKHRRESKYTENTLSRSLFVCRRAFRNQQHHPLRKSNVNKVICVDDMEIKNFQKNTQIVISSRVSAVPQCLH